LQTSAYASRWHCSLSMMKAWCSQTGACRNQGKRHSPRTTGGDGTWAGGPRRNAWSASQKGGAERLKSAETTFYHHRRAARAEHLLQMAQDLPKSAACLNQGTTVFGQAHTGAKRTRQFCAIPSKIEPFQQCSQHGPKEMARLTGGVRLIALSCHSAPKWQGQRC